MSVLLEAWAESELSEDSNPIAMHERVDFPKKQLAHQ